VVYICEGRYSAGAVRQAGRGSQWSHPSGIADGKRVPGGRQEVLQYPPKRQVCSSRQAGSGRGIERKPGIQMRQKEMQKMGGRQCVTAGYGENGRQRYISRV